jgi:MFS transporter, MHS family, proline/betaine transporter
VSIIGRIADKYKKLPLLEISAIGCILLSGLFYLSIKRVDLASTLIVQFILVTFFSAHVALIPSTIAELYPTKIRYTAIGFSFNICDGVLWGVIPILSGFLIQKTHRIDSFVILFPVSAVMFLISYHFVKKLKKTEPVHEIE